MKNLAVSSESVLRALDQFKSSSTKLTFMIYDFGGQSVFHAIHPFFMTRCGVYLIAFNMQWLLPSAYADERNECLRWLTFWVNSVVVHTSRIEGEVHSTAPVAFVGTHKDLVPDATDHNRISTLLFETFHANAAWPYLMTNAGAQGARGTQTLNFFPVNNRIGNRDSTFRSLMNVVEAKVDASDYVHDEKPLGWFRALDDMTAKGTSYLSLDEATAIAAEYGVSPSSAREMLGYYHQLGVLMWHDEEGLRDTVILDPINFFVAPATTVICKHSPVGDDPTHHQNSTHKICQQQYSVDFNKMVD